METRLLQAVTPAACSAAASFFLALAETERDIILQIISLDRRTARDVMLPRSQIPSVSDDLSIEDMVVAAQKVRQRRLPILDPGTDTIMGILNTQALLLDPTTTWRRPSSFPPLRREK